MALGQLLGVRSSGGVPTSGSSLQDVSLLQRERNKKKPQAIVKTAEEEALERRQRSLLDKEIEESEERFKALARDTLGRSSLLGGAASNVQAAAGASRGSSGTGSLLGSTSPGASRGRSPRRGGVPAIRVQK